MTSGDSRAIKTLLSAYWGGGGWRLSPGAEPADVAHAIEAGVMFAHPITASHDEVISGVIAARERVSLLDATRHFLSSLPSRRLEMRSVLCSRVVAHHLRLHEFVPGPSIDGDCALCGLAEVEQDIDRNILNFERHKWGGVRHADLTYVWMDLQLSVDMALPNASMEASGRKLFEGMLSYLEGLAPEITAVGAASKKWPGLESNKAEREIIRDKLGLCSILKVSGHEGFLESFVPAKDRVLPPQHNIERAYPTCWWRAGSGVDRAVAQRLQLI